ncbi:MAG: hypothetical protein ACRC6L_10885, partial [Steroidobacteraceae bacterium]
DGTLYAHENFGDADLPMIALSETRYLVPGLPAPLRFVLPATGPATQLVSEEISELALDRTGP